MENTRYMNQRRALSFLMAVVVLVGLIVPALAAIEWPTRIERFERYSPVYSETVALGTAREELKLPEYLRAEIPLSELELDPESFVQAEPEMDMSDGYTHYDYFYYGYVAPKGVDQLYEHGDLAIYSIYYANPENPEQVGEVAYRVYGSINGSENVWFACDEVGSISGVVLDIPVTWEGSYDSEAEGEYLFTANIAGYTYGQARPYAKIMVKDIEIGEESPACTCGAEPDETGALTHAQDCPLYTEQAPECTCGTEDPMNHAQDCPLHMEEEHCACQVGKDEYSHLHGEDCPFYEMLLCTCDLQTNEKGDQHDASCPQYIRLAVDCHCGPDGEPIDADNFPWAHQEDCIHFSPIECMCREIIEVWDTTWLDGQKITQRMPVLGELTHEHDPENTDCPLYGRDTVSIRKMDENSLSARMMGGTTSVMAKEDAERIVTSQQAREQAKQEAADENAVQQDEQAPVRKQNAALFATQADPQPEEGAEALYPALGNIQIVEGSEQSGNGYDAGMELLSINGGGAKDIDGDLIMVRNSPTSGNASYISEYSGGLEISGAWVDYVNTIWENKAIRKFAWSTLGSYKNWKWSGVVANSTSGTIADNPLRIPVQSADGKWRVYSGEQLRWALLNVPDGSTILIAATMNLNGNVYDWESVAMNNNAATRDRKIIFIEGNNQTILNLGQITDAAEYNGLFHMAAACSVKDLNFVGAKMVRSAGSAPVGMFNVGSPTNETGYYKNIFSNIQIRDSLFYTADEWAVIPFGYLCPSGVDTVDSAGVMNYRAFPEVTACIAQGNLIYGQDHISGFALNLGNSQSTNNATYAESRWGVVRNSASFDNLLCGTGGHSAAFVSCGGDGANIDSCFAANETYGSVMVAGFRGGQWGNTTNCFSTGKLEGYSVLGGFAFSFSDEPRGGKNRLFENCYSTTLVGLRTTPSRQGGFISSEPGKISTDIVKNCYAAGEVGNYDVNMNAPKDVGGFLDLGSNFQTSVRAQWTNNYYDKQTTAMREWWDGRSNLPNTKMTGVLTTSVMLNDRKIPGLTDDPTLPGYTSHQTIKGFAGFTDNSKWVFSSNAQHYPQLATLANATAADWGGQSGHG